MKKYLVAIIVVFMLSGCYFEIIDSGQVGVEIANGKVSKEIKEEGLHFSFNPMADLDVFNTKSKILEMSMEKQDDSLEAIYEPSVTILTKDNLQIPIDVTILYKLNKICAPQLRINYGVDYYWDTKVVLPKARDVVRGVIGKDADVYKLNQDRDVYSAKIQDSLTQDIDRMLGQEKCIEIDSVSIKNINLPQQLMDSILRKQQTEEAVKIANLEVEKIKAQAQAEIEKNKGVAEAQVILSKSITPEMIKWKELEIQQQTIEKWNGVTPTTILSDKTKPMIMIK